MEKWDACAFKVDAEELEGRVCYGGLDLSSTTDITAFVLVFPPVDEEDKFCIMPYCLYNGVKTLAFQAKPLGQPHTSKFRKKKYRDTKLEVKKWKTIESQHIVRMISNIT